MKTEQTQPTNTLNTKNLWERRDYLWQKYCGLILNGTKEKWEEFTGESFSDKYSFEDFRKDGFELCDWDSDFEGGELYQLNTLHDSVGSWAEDCNMVREDHFVEYAENWARGLHDIPTMLDNCIDWDKFADTLRNEWSTFEFMGEEYLVENC